MKNLFLLLGLCFIICSCSENDKNLIYLPISIQFPTDENALHLFEYDDEHRLILFQRVPQEKATIDSIRFVYDSLGKIQEIIYNDGRSSLFKYNSHEILEINSDITNYYGLNSNGQIIHKNKKEEMDWFHVYYEFSYDNIGNILENYYVDDDNKMGDEEIEYDRKKGIFSGVKSPQIIYFSVLNLEYCLYLMKNNVLKVQDIQTSKVSSITYEYNRDDYPVKMTNDKNEIVTVKYKIVAE